MDRFFKNIETINNCSLIRYDGFSDRSIYNVIKYGNKIKLINDVSLAVFSIINNDVLLKKMSAEDDNYYDLYIPFYLGLPYWLERGLILINAKVPTLKYVGGKPFSVHNNIHMKILEVIESKLNQRIQEL